jgi:pimeloyl-ACP methyl ester carboxylesterase
VNQTALVFVHGLFSNAATWDNFISLITADPDLSHIFATRFEYPSPAVEADPRRRIPDYNAITDALMVFLARETHSFEQVVLVTHSQGGLIVQRYLAQMLEAGRGLELQRIRLVLMFSCPNDGSDFLLGMRRSLAPWKNAQERQLRPLDEQVAQARRVVLDRIVFASQTSASACRIRVSAYAGLSDNVVKPGSAKGAFPEGGSLPGDHNSIIQPLSYDDPSFRTLKWELLRAVPNDFISESAPTNRLVHSGTTAQAVRATAREPGELARLPLHFLNCLEEADHICYFNFAWCRAISDNTISLSHYVVPRVRAFGVSGELPVELDELFYNWMNGKRKNLLLLGEYGAGKTSACLYLYRRLAASVARDPDQAPLPVYISLDMFSRGRPSGLGLFDLLSFALGAANSEVRAQVGQRNGFIFILDGLDEMSASAALSAIRSNLSLLRPFFASRHRVLISCRTHLFASATDLETALSGIGLAGDLLADIKSTHDYVIAELQNLSASEIQRIIRLVRPDDNPIDVWNEMGRYYDLQDLSRRPILLGLVLKSLPILRVRSEQGNIITEAGVYDAYLHDWTMRELSNKRLQSDPEKKLRLAEEIAVLMYQFEVSAIDRPTLAREVRHTYGDDIFSNSDFELFDYDTRDASFLTCNLAGEFSFLHRSFYEYFTARAFISSVTKDDRSATWRARWLTQEIANFSAQLLSSIEFRTSLRRIFNMVLNTDNPIELWNSLHIISLMKPADLSANDTEVIGQQIIPRGFREERSVLVRQYARVAARFVSSESGEALIRRVLDLISFSATEQEDNSRTYINYYGGSDAACAAFLAHISTPTRKYDRQLHVHMLGQLGLDVHARALRDLTRRWSNEEDLRAAAESLDLIERRGA